MKLTKRQELFAQAIVDGKTQVDAYIAAGYKVDAMTDASMYSLASRLAKNVKVASRIKELRDRLAERTLWTREMSVRALVKAYKSADKAGQCNAMTQAIRELNRMHGYDAPQQIEISGPGGGPVQTISQEMTPEEAAAAYAATVTDTRQV